MEKIVDPGAPSEMAIVDVFTKLIFGVDQQWDDGESEIVQALRQVDQNVCMDSTQEMGVYLRALGVKEMIELVARVRSRLGQGGVLNASLEAGSDRVKAPQPRR